MTHKVPLATAVVLASVGLGSAASADSLSCGGRIVATGDSTYRVRSVCGDPDDATRRTEIRTVRRRVRVPCTDAKARHCNAFVERSVEVVIDTWTYDFGRHRFLQHLTFEQGALRRVEAGTYGEK